MIALLFAALLSIDQVGDTVTTDGVIWTGLDLRIFVWFAVAWIRLNQAVADRFLWLNGTHESHRAAATAAAGLGRRLGRRLGRVEDILLAHVAAD